MRAPKQSVIRRVVIAALALLAMAIATTAAAGAAGHAALRHGATVPTIDPATTLTAAPTTAPVTTPPTTVPVTTPPTTVPVTTVPTTVAPTTTTTTTVPPAKSSGGSSTPWGAIIAIVAGIALIAIAIGLLLRRRSLGAAQQTWNASAASALADATLVRDMLSRDENVDQPQDPTRQRTERDRVDQIATRFEQLALTAPSDESRQQATDVATSLRGYLFALEAERLLRTAPTPPTGDQLATADATRRARAADLDRGLAALRTLVEPPERP